MLQIFNILILKERFLFYNEHGNYMHIQRRKTLSLQIQSHFDIFLLIVFEYMCVCAFINAQNFMDLK
jgi:hypothetical protein